MKLTTRVVCAAVIAAGGATVTGCTDDGPLAGQSEPPASTPAPAPPSTPAGPPPSPPASIAPGPPTATIEVQAIDNTFRPQRVEVPAGTEVVWVNRGRNDHDLLSDFDFGVAAEDFRPGDEYRYVFTEPGEYPYYCTIHGTHEIGMTGTVVVTDTA